MHFSFCIPNLLGHTVDTLDTCSSASVKHMASSCHTAGICNSHVRFQCWQAPLWAQQGVSTIAKRGLGNCLHGLQDHTALSWSPWLNSHTSWSFVHPGGTSHLIVWNLICWSASHCCNRCDNVNFKAEKHCSCFSCMIRIGNREVGYSCRVATIWSQWALKPIKA